MEYELKDYYRVTKMEEAVQVSTPTFMTHNMHKAQKIFFEIVYIASFFRRELHMLRYMLCFSHSITSRSAFVKGIVIH